MPNDLVSRLRLRANEARALGFNGDMDDEAADRIEALERENGPSDLGQAREEGRAAAFREAAEIAREWARILRTNMDAFDPNAANQCDVLAEAIEAAAKAGEK